MAKVKVKDEKSLQEAKEKLRGTVNFRKTKYGVIAAKSKWPKSKFKIQNAKIKNTNQKPKLEKSKN